MAGDWVAEVAISIGTLPEDDEDEEFDEVGAPPTTKRAPSLATSLWALFKRSMSFAGPVLRRPTNLFWS
jgi:hypothetical protein